MMHCFSEENKATVSTTILKECKPLFGLVKHHVPAKFQIQATEEHNEGQSGEALMDLSRSISIDPFSSLPPNMTLPHQR